MTGPSVSIDEDLVALLEMDVPRSVQAMLTIKNSVVDTVAVMIAGERTNFSGALRNSMDRMYSANPHENSLADSAMYDAYMAHCLDYDDVHGQSLSHLSAVVVPALIAGESLMKSLAFDFVAGYAVACQAAAALLAGLGGLSHYGRGWHATSTVGGPAVRSWRTTRRSRSTGW